MLGELALFGIISLLDCLGGLALDKGGDGLAKVFTLVLGNSQLLLARLTGTITVAIYQMSLEHALSDSHISFKSTYATVPAP